MRDFELVIMGHLWPFLCRGSNEVESPPVSTRPGECKPRAGALGFPAKSAGQPHLGIAEGSRGHDA